MMENKQKRKHIAIRARAGSILDAMRVGRLDYTSIIEYLLVRADFMREEECEKNVFQTSQLIENFFNKTKGT